MKEKLFALLFIAMSSTNVMAQLSYDGNLTFNRTRHANFVTTWGGWAHYWGQNDNLGIKMHIHASDPRMSSTTSKLVFYDSDRNMYIDLYCRTMYQTSDEKLKTNIRPLRESLGSNSVVTRRLQGVSNPLTDMVVKLNPVVYRWKDEAEYERYNLRPVGGRNEEYGFLAQDLEEVIPGAVAMTDEGDKLVNYSAIIPLLTGAIQELNERVAQLETELEALKKAKTIK